MTKMPIKRKIIPANPGFFVITEKNNDSDEVVGLHHQEILAWIIEILYDKDDSWLETELYAVTVATSYHCFKDEIILKEPNGRFRSQLNDDLHTDTDVLHYFKRKPYTTP